MKFNLSNLQFDYNSKVILTYLFICLGAWILNIITRGKSNKKLFQSYRSSPFNPLTYIRMFTHCIGHKDLDHLISNFLYILLVGPMIEEKYGTINLLIMILSTAFITGVINSIISKNRILGASGIVFMLIVLSSFVNISSGKIPITLVLIFIFYIVNEIIDGIFKKDNVSHLGHLIGAICGLAFGIYFLHYSSFIFF